MPIPAVLSYPASMQQLQKGFNTLAELLALTLGPTQGVVLSSTDTQPKPELLSDAATIARRIIALPERGQDVGAMLLRNLVWRVHQRVGDGTALTAVLARALLERASLFVSAGANPALVQRGIQRGAQAALQAINQAAQPVEELEDMIAVAQSVTGQLELSRVLGEMFDLLGSEAYITIEDYTAPYLERVYLDGGRWEAGLISPYLINSPGSGRGILRECQVALADHELTDLEQVRPLLELAHQEKTGALLLVAHKISGEALSTLVSNHLQRDLKILAVNLQRTGQRLHDDLEDLALLTGAQILSPDLGRDLRKIKNSDLGRARRAEAGAKELFVVGGQGASAVIRQQVDRLHRRMSALPFDDEARPELQMRLGRMSGSTAILKIGALTKTERDFLHQKAEQGLLALQATLQEGALPGGGSAYLRASHAVQCLEEAETDQAMGLKAITFALQAPFRQIMLNAGREDAGYWMEELINSPPDTVFDVLDGGLRPARQAGVLDPAKVLRVALETAVSGAAMALSTETVILKRKPKISYEP